MTGTRTVKAEVLVAAGNIVRVRREDLVEVTERAGQSPQKRARLCTHPTVTDPLHEMLICLVHGTYVRPHRHAKKSESFHVIEGELDVVLFHSDGTIREVIPMGSYASGKVFFYRLMEPCFHTVLVHSSHVLFHETTNGPFDPADTEFASWAPPEGDPASHTYRDTVHMNRITVESVIT